MERYKNKRGDSGVSGYNIHQDSISVEFTSGKIYTYSYGKAGAGNVEQMKRLAINGEGLCSFIQKHVKDKFD